MLQAEGADAPIKVEFDNFEHGFPPGFGPGGWGYLAYAIGIAFALFQLYVAAIPDLPSPNTATGGPSARKLKSRGMDGVLISVSGSTGRPAPGWRR